ncbi:hypothetical protein EUX98_g9140 [Antrodiella citrinella]|uniref:Uncharacterized protein n=1 Tax=Antrodiella citrinella TaxID=2447956 RepID=A0A4V3XFG0_9APHY|nr:hypothetical protein EUX98_g9140 [Antrodiella citrinella]
MTGSSLVDMIKAQAAAQAQQVQEILNDTNPIDPNMPISPAFISNARPSDANPATTRSRSRANSIADEDLVEDQAGTVNQDTPNLYEGLEDVLSSVDASFDEEDMEASRNHLGDILGDYATSPPASSYHSSPGGSDDE